VDRRNLTFLLLGLLIIALLIVGYYFLLLGPLRSEYGDVVQERSDKEAQLAELQQQVNELEQIRDNAPEIERQLLELSKRIPEQPEIATLVVQIEEIANAANVTQLLIEPGAPEAPPGGGDFQRIPVTMSFEGTYEQLQDFLLRSRNLARLVTINEVTYELEGAEEGEGTVAATETAAAAGVERLLQVEIQAEVYFQPSEGSAGPAPGAAPPPPPPEEVTTPEETVPGGTTEGSEAGSVTGAE
jgi:type IV pilus assembly protein PilO